MTEKTLNIFGSRQWVAIAMCQAMLMLVTSGCTSREAKLIKETREQCNSSDIRRVVIPLFLKYKYPTNEDAGMVIPFNEVPKEIQSLPLFSISPELVITWWDGHGSALAFITGSGFGHWGMVVCRDENNREFDKTSGYTYWENGIYFYRGR